MKNPPNTAAHGSSNRNCRFIILMAGAASLAAAIAPTFATADVTDRSGKEVVQHTCRACHATGKEGAPKIGDKQAWAKLASRGLSSLTQSALAGVRKMPAHGGSADASDIEISRAITYMVNQSGGKWIEPVGKTAPVAKAGASTERTGQNIVRVQCGKCHLTGENGAPKVGDRDAWVQRLKRGMDEIVRSAFNGHGPMPVRGGLADITVNEMRGAITYMFNPASATMLAPIAKPVVPLDPYHKVIGNTEIFFGIASANSIRAGQKNRGVAVIADIPDGAGYYYVNVTLRDRTSEALVTNAQVVARVEDPALRGESKTLDLMAINRGISYGSFFELPTKGRYVISVTVQRPDASQPAETRFEFSRD